MSRPKTKSQSIAGPYRHALLAAGLAAPIPLAGCAGPLRQIARNVEHLCRAEALNGSLPKQRVAVLLASSRPELGQWRQSASDTPVGVFREERPELTVVPWIRYVWQDLSGSS